MPDYSFLAKPAIPSGVQTLGGMMDIAGKAQAIQQGGVQLQQQKMDLQERNNLRSLGARLKEFTGANGQPDFNALTEEATKIAPKMGADWVKNIAATHVEGVHARSALNELDAQEREQVARVLAGIADDSPEAQMSVINGLIQSKPHLIPALSFLTNRMLPGAKTPEERATMFRRAAQSALPVTTQKELITPTGPTYESGAESGLINTNPFAGKVGKVKGTQVEKELPPTTVVYGKDNVPTYLGRKPGAELPPGVPESDRSAYEAVASGALKTASPSPGGLQAGPNPSTTGSIQNLVDTMHADYGENSVRALGAQQNIGVLENIKKYAKGAITGVETDRRAYLIGLVGLLGGDKAQAAKTDTDVLIKNATMLSQQGGHTDAERQLVSAMNPNNHMTPQAIEKAADQVIAQQQLPLVRQKHLQQFVNDPQKYNDARVEFNQHADPRVIQWKGMSKAERADMLKAMKDNEKVDFLRNGKWFEDKGLYQ